MSRDEKIDLGSVQVHKKVFAEIIALALKDVEGVSLIQQNLSGRLCEILGRRDFPGIVVKVDSSHEVTLELKVLVRYGMNIPDAARQIQETVKSAVDKTLDVIVKDIHVNVQGIAREEK